MRNRASTFISLLGNATIPPVGLGYGRLYNSYAFLDANFSPTDWKVPTSSEVQTLFNYLGGNTVAGGKLKETGTVFWNSPNTGADNSSGFTLLGGGLRYGTTSPGVFAFLKMYGEFVSTTQRHGAYYLSEQSYSASLESRRGNSVRLLYTGVGTPTTMTDYDGNIYDVVQIGTQYWIIQNWKCTHLNNGTSIPEVTLGASWNSLTSLAWCYYDNDSGNL